jgi:hypothetical protein
MFFDNVMNTHDEAMNMHDDDDGSQVSADALDEPLLPIPHL